MFHNRLLFVFLIVAVLFVLPGGMHSASAGTFTDCASVTEIPTTECDALVALYINTSGWGWDANWNWLVTDTPSDWFRVTIVSGHVTELQLGGLGLNGSIPIQLGNLAFLTNLLLDRNQLNSIIPPELGNLVSLQELRLDNNQLSGNIPPELGNLANLEWLFLNSNQLSGIIPRELGNLTQLRGLSLLNNQLSGIIPPELGNLTNLDFLLALNNNQLSGSIPPELGNLTKLQRLWLTNNQLNGSLPSELGNLINLTSLYLDGNALIGSIPLSFTALTKLNIFYTATWQCEPKDTTFLNWWQGILNRSPQRLCYSISGQVKWGDNPLPGVTISDGIVHSTTSAADGTYTLADIPPYTYTLTPEFSGYVFDPISRVVAITYFNQTGQDFTVSFNKIFIPLVTR